MDNEDENEQTAFVEGQPGFFPNSPPVGDLETHAEAIDALIETDGGDLVSLVQALQRHFGYLPGDVLEHLARRTGISLARLYGVVTFYSGFTLQPRGRRLVRVCQGTACHVRGSERVADALSEALGIESGETTDDMEYTLESAACLGCCSLAPVVSVGESIHAGVEPAGAASLLEEG